jgi:hypothetical protein
MDYIDALRL